MVGILDKQCNIYSVDTGHFYSGHERYLHNMNCRYRRERNYLVKKSPESEELIRHKREKAKQSKQKLLTLLSHRMAQNLKTNGKDHTRILDPNLLNDNNVISVFDSSLTRTLGAQQGELIDDLIVVQIYYFDVFKDLFYYGFWFKGEKYQYLTSSAGQIRRKKAVFIKESSWAKIEKTVMCGLTVEQINAHGGNNANKHLAYMALANSATDVWEDFDIDRAIVVEDFATNVAGTFDLIDDTDYSITRKTGDIAITHTDGAGMMLPCVMSHNTMFRAPWIKGLLGVFDYRRFIEEHHCSPIIRDVYGNAHDVIAEDIQILLTKSQFKMWKYYSSWEEYKEDYKKYGCTAGRCNIEEDRFPNAKINYQMLQTLTNITEEEIQQLSERSVRRVSNVCSNVQTMKDILGITPYNTRMTPFQKAVKIYPALLSDTYAKDLLREVKNSLVKKYRSGKLEVCGKYTFILPDFYAACEYWFCHIDNPKGLLADQEVFCNLFQKSEKLDCLRSPHLYREHAVRFNVACYTYGQSRTENARKWFTTNGLYTSTHDMISRILQFDVDGDKSLVVSDPLFVKIAERNMNGIVPLYYNMRKAAPTELNKENIYRGLNMAFTHGNIGIYSNDISKIWNSDVFVTGTDKERQEALDCIKLLCMENNFCIDAAKAMYMPQRPEWFRAVVSKFTRQKLPAFFQFAKDKDKTQVTERNGSFVNRLYELVPNKPINTRGMNLGRIDYRDMMGNVNMRCPRDVAQLYDKLNRQYQYMVNMKDEYTDNLMYVANKVRGEFSGLGYTNETIADMLVEYLYGHGKRTKQLLWFCYGQYILNNLERNVVVQKTKFVQCVDCGEWFEVDLKSKSQRCRNCQHELRKSQYRRSKKRRFHTC